MAAFAAEGVVFGPEVVEDCLESRWVLLEKAGRVKSGKLAPDTGLGGGGD